jgi:hypothetical protein
MNERHYLLLLSILLSVHLRRCVFSRGSIASVGNGSFPLALGEARSMQIGGFYREFRVCNDTGGTGTVEATVSNQPPIQLAPGVCWREYGDSLNGAQCLLERSDGTDSFLTLLCAPLGAW